ncbi:hypothetical protein RSAG8_13151, partial [Rhizoctonia solani AG-8 WAC10335]
MDSLSGDLPPALPESHEGGDTNLNLKSQCLSLIRLAFWLWNGAIIRSREDFVAMMRALVSIDETLKYACRSGRIDLVGLEVRVRVAYSEIQQALNVLSVRLKTVSPLVVALDLGREANPTRLMTYGDAIKMYVHTAPRPRLVGHTYENESRILSSEEIVLDSYRDGFSRQVGILNNPSAYLLGAQYHDGRSEWVIRSPESPYETAYLLAKTLGIEYLKCQEHLASDSGYVLIGPNPRVHLLISLKRGSQLSSFDQEPRLYSLFKHVQEQTFILKGNVINRSGHLIYHPGALEGLLSPWRLYWTLHRLNINVNGELDTHALVPVELPLIGRQTDGITPMGHLQALLDTWQYIVELEKQPGEDVAVGWLIEVDEYPTASKEASYYLDFASDEGLTALSKRMGCRLYSDSLVLSPCLHSVLGRVHYGTLTYIPVGTVVESSSVGFVKDLRSIWVDYSRVKHLHELKDTIITRIFRRWSKCYHPNVLSLFGIRKMPRNGIGLVFPETSKKCLSEYLDTTPDLDRCKLCVQISSGLTYLHKVGVVHGKLRAANILVSLTGEAIVSDPRLLGDSMGGNTHERVGWLAPEVTKGEFSTQASDVYSLGMTILEVISGALPDVKRHDAEVLDLESSGLESALPERPENSIPVNSKDGNALWTLLSHCCSVDPSSRPITDVATEIMKSITRDGLRDSRAFQEESFELTDTESESSFSSDAGSNHANIDGPNASNPNAKDHGLLGSESPMVGRVREIIRHLAVHGCENLTDHIDRDSFSNHPFSGGAFGDVYRGSLLGGLRIALKTPRISLNVLEENPDYLTDVAREIHTWSKCDHPNVLHFLGLAELRGQIGMVAPWMEHGRLTSYLEKVFSVDRCKLCTQICEGVAYLHHIGIVHGDLKGENVLISGDGVAVISDFGGSLLRNRSLKIIPLEKGSCLTYRWAAPELLLQGGMDETDEPNDMTETRLSQTGANAALNAKESDIYALGMTILEIISGRLPWYWIKNEPAIIIHVCSPGKLHKRPNEIPMDSLAGDKLWTLLNECWAYKPDLRPTAIEVGNVMRDIIPGALKVYPPPAIGNRCALFD